MALVELIWCFIMSTAAQYNALHRSLVREGEGDKGFEGGQDEGVVSVTLADMLCALKEVRPSAMREIILEVPKVKDTHPITMIGILQLKYQDLKAHFNKKYIYF